MSKRCVGVTAEVYNACIGDLIAQEIFSTKRLRLRVCLSDSITVEVMDGHRIKGRLPLTKHN